MKKLITAIILVINFVTVNYALAALEVAEVYPIQQKVIPTEKFQFVQTIILVLLYLGITNFAIHFIYGLFVWFGYSGGWDGVEEAQRRLARGSGGLFFCVAMVVLVKFFGLTVLEQGYILINNIGK